MGGSTFQNLGTGATAQEAFDKVTSEARHEYGHGGYSGSIAEKTSFVLIQTEPLSSAAAQALADQLISDSDERIDDKWGPAGAIPVILSTRTINVGDLSGSVADWQTGRDGDCAVVTQVLKDRKLLRPGETVKAARLSAYTQPDRFDRYSRTSRPTTFTQGSAQVEINKAGGPVTRTETVVLTAAADLDWSTREQWEPDVRAKVRLGADESIVQIQLRNNFDADRPQRKTKVMAEATKGTTKTRYVVLGSDRSTWARGFDSQAEARAWATKALQADMENPLPRLHRELAIEGVTRREDGRPLVTIVGTVTKTTASFDVTIARKLSGTADAWLFFGWASS